LAASCSNDLNPDGRPLRVWRGQAENLRLKPTKEFFELPHPCIRLGHQERLLQLLRFRARAALCLGSHLGSSFRALCGGFPLPAKFDLQRTSSKALRTISSTSP